MVGMNEYKECMEIEKDIDHSHVYLILADAAIAGNRLLDLDQNECSRSDKMHSRACGMLMPGCRINSRMIIREIDGRLEAAKIAFAVVMAPSRTDIASMHVFE